MSNADLSEAGAIHNTLDKEIWMNEHHLFGKGILLENWFSNQMLNDSNIEAWGDANVKDLGWKGGYSIVWGCRAELIDRITHSKQVLSLWYS